MEITTLNDVLALCAIVFGIPTVALLLIFKWAR